MADQRLLVSVGICWCFCEENHDNFSSIQGRHPPGRLHGEPAAVHRQGARRSGANPREALRTMVALRLPKRVLALMLRMLRLGAIWERSVNGLDMIRIDKTIRHTRFLVERF